MTDEGPYDRVAVHGHIDRDEMPDAIDLVDDHDAEYIVEIVYMRDSDEYTAFTRAYRRLMLKHEWPRDDLDAALKDAIVAARDGGHPIQRTIYTLAPISTEADIGADRLPRPWLDNE